MGKLSSHKHFKIYSILCYFQLTVIVAMGSMVSPARHVPGARPRRRGETQPVRCAVQGRLPGK